MSSRRGRVRANRRAWQREPSRRMAERPSLMADYCEDNAGAPAMNGSVRAKVSDEIAPSSTIFRKDSWIVRPRGSPMFCQGRHCSISRPRSRPLFVSALLHAMRQRLVAAQEALRAVVAGIARALLLFIGNVRQPPKICAHCRSARLQPRLAGNRDA